jgi:hypothetical protein
MASFVYTPAKVKLASGDLDLNAHDIRVLLVMTNTTAHTDQDAATLSAITLDEYDGANYVRKALANEAVNQDDANNRAEFDADDFTWTALGIGTRQCKAMVAYRYVDGTAANDIPIAYLDNAPELPFWGNGSDIPCTFNAEGILQLT